jgi:hypothetical protein
MDGLTLSIVSALLAISISYLIAILIKVMAMMLGKIPKVVHLDALPLLADDTADTKHGDDSEIAVLIAVARSIQLSK